MALLVLSSLEFCPHSRGRGCFFVLLMRLPVCGVYCSDCSEVPHLLARLVVSYCSPSTNLFILYFQNSASCQLLHSRFLSLVPCLPVFPVLLRDAKLHPGSADVFQPVLVTLPQVSYVQLYLSQFQLSCCQVHAVRRWSPLHLSAQPLSPVSLKVNSILISFSLLIPFPHRIRASASPTPVLIAERCANPYFSCCVDLAPLFPTPTYGVMFCGVVVFAILRRVDSPSLTFTILFP